MTDTTHPNQHATPMQDDAPRKGATPLLWILLAVAIVAFAWWYSANRNAASVAGYDTTPIGSAQTATEAEPTAVATRPGRAATAQRPGRATTATRTPAIEGAQLLAHAKPRYPAEEQRRGVQGSVTLRIAIDANGVPTDVGYASRSGNNALDRAALVAARDWRFKPAVRNGQAVASTVNVPVDFKL